ncbi:eukaryotic translation initiation factor 5-like [Paramacrobiotus metropolitanus]|uniref:eukaryotic translation initiation factor 5-like n=1 Tax=Paramacrobiotus metropolitanus TaxID=2943436 RepID=UPI0024461D9A|nr:eukaryotic translation initiation factor 5-like [Paramacrobiotus metropolitanus]XP_055331941.1 eukaryotic translation initiation factor 5-like [Paramacrobiotus metropolitanus]XP_055331942.1 eukaryotic translation initiation factor 5-like [Paramacrobiotus metropolitanus]
METSQGPSKNADAFNSTLLIENARHDREKVTNGIKNLTTNDDLDKTEDERLDLFYEFVKKRKQGSQVDDKEILMEAERLEVKEKAPLILARVLLDTNMLKQIKDYRKVFLRFTAGNQRAQKYFLGGVEHIVGVAHKSELMPKAAVLFMELYNQDILEGEVLMDWCDKPTRKYVAKSIAEEIRKEVFPFTLSLKKAETKRSGGNDHNPQSSSSVKKPDGEIKGVDTSCGSSTAAAGSAPECSTAISVQPMPVSQPHSLLKRLTDGSLGFESFEDFVLYSCPSNTNDSLSRSTCFEWFLEECAGWLLLLLIIGLFGVIGYLLFGV